MNTANLDPRLCLRPAQPGDVVLILAFIRELAEYEHLSHMVMADESALQASLFGDRPYAEVIIAEHDGTPAGFALFFHNYSTFLGKPGLYLEDLFVRPAFRKLGIGRALLLALARLALERGCGRYEWSVLDWNTPSIEFYKALGAKPMTEWQLMRAAGDDLKAMVARATGTQAGADEGQ
jgi:GNAT superfamily N-acetyltransferase